MDKLLARVFESRRVVGAYGDKSLNCILKHESLHTHTVTANETVKYAGIIG